MPTNCCIRPFMTMHTLFCCPCCFNAAALTHPVPFWSVAISEIVTRCSIHAERVQLRTGTQELQAEVHALQERQTALTQVDGWDAATADPPFRVPVPHTPKAPRSSAVQPSSTHLLSVATQQQGGAQQADHWQPAIRPGNCDHSQWRQKLSVAAVIRGPGVTAHAPPTPAGTYPGHRLPTPHQPWPVRQDTGVNAEPQRQLLSADFSRG